MFRVKYFSIKIMFANTGLMANSRSTHSHPLYQSSVIQSFQNIKNKCSHYLQEICSPHWDGASCFPPSLANTLVTIPCMSSYNAKRYNTNCKHSLILATSKDFCSILLFSCKLWLNWNNKTFCCDSGENVTSKREERMNVWCIIFQIMLRGSVMEEECGMIWQTMMSVPSCVPWILSWHQMLEETSPGLTVLAPRMINSLLIYRK